MLNSKLKVETWAQDKNPVFAFFAINHALVARIKSDALRHIKERRVYGHEFSLPDLPQWFAMYTSRKPILAYKRFIAGYSELAHNEIEIFLGLRKLEKLSKKNPSVLTDMKFTPEDIQTSQEKWRSMCSEIYDQIREERDQAPLTPEKQERFETSLKKDELTLGFYFLVYAPCHLFYGISPSELYRKALDRDVSALEQLLKLDPLAIHDPAIGFQIQSVRLYGKINDYERIIGAISKKPRLNYKMISDERRSIKSEHGGYILALATALKQPLMASQVRDLYDNLASDFEDEEEDADIMKPAGFDKSVQMKAATYQKLFQVKENQK